MKVKVRTKQGGFRDDRFHFTTKWTDVEEAELSSVHIEHPNIEVKTAEGKYIPTPDLVPGVSLPRVDESPVPIPAIVEPEKEG